METRNMPLAVRMRPEKIDDIVGQDKLLGKGKILREFIQNDNIPSMILWGPPGIGKTSIANVIAKETKARFYSFSAVSNSIKDIKKLMEEIDEGLDLEKTIVFVDEFHRFNKSQQDAFLPYVEKGSIILIGATTENPSFEINNALLSRMRVFVLEALDAEDIYKLLSKAINSENGLENVSISNDSLHKIANVANGDARNALTTLELAYNYAKNIDGMTYISEEDINNCLSRKSLLYDKKGEEHYNIISALHKSMRNSDPDAAIYWLARMLEGGEEPLYIARRIIRFASEDIGLADINALKLANDAYSACHYIGMPECALALAEAVIYMSLAPKSNSVYVAYEKAKDDAIYTASLPVPMQIRNAPTKLMKDVDYGKGYIYAHDTEDKIALLECMPDNLRGTRYYFPGSQGYEQKLKERLDNINKWKKIHKNETK